VEAVFIAAVSMARFSRSVRVETTGFDGQGVVDDQLGRHHRVDLGRVAALQGDGIAQAARSTRAVWPRMS